jgi:hypothetical protein
MRYGIVLITVMGISSAIAEDAPPVKKSSTGICHAQGSSYYAQTKKFEAFKTMDDCLKSGGRLPKK